MGLPAAGKSTLCEKLMDVKTHDVKIVRFDDDLEATGALEQWAPEKYHEARSMSLRRVQGLLETSSASIIVADDNNHLRSMRHALFRLARDSGWAYATVRLECSQEVAEARNATRQGRERVPPETITQMARDLEPPDPLRMGWERFAITVASDQIQEVLNAADRARKAGPPILPEDLEVLQERAREARERTLASKKHALDLALRACVGDVASACAESLKKKDRATLGKALAAARKDVLGNVEKLRKRSRALDKKEGCAMVLAEAAADGRGCARLAPMPHVPSCATPVPNLPARYPAQPRLLRLPPLPPLCPPANADHGRRG